MIRSQSEYRESISRAEAGRRHLVEHEANLKTMDLEPDEVVRMMAPVVHLQQKLEAEVARYERLKQGDIDETWDLADVGRLLVEARIVKGLSQRALAKKLDVHESLVSRDERNEYHGLSIDRARQILDAMGVEVKFQVEAKTPKPLRRMDSRSEMALK